MTEAIAPRRKVVPLGPVKIDFCYALTASVSCICMKNLLIDQNSHLFMDHSCTPIVCDSIAFAVIGAMAEVWTEDIEGKAMVTCFVFVGCVQLVIDFSLSVLITINMTASR